MEHTQVRSVPYCFRPFFSSFSYYNTKGFNLACACAPLSLKENHRKDEEEEEEEIGKGGILVGMRKSYYGWNDAIDHTT